MQPCNYLRLARSSWWPRFYNLSCVAARDWVVDDQATQHPAATNCPGTKTAEGLSAADCSKTRHGSEVMRHLSMRARSGSWSSLLLSAGTAALVASAAQAAPLVKECGKNGQFVIGFSKANTAEPYRQHVNDDLAAAAKKVPQFALQIADGAGNVNTQTSQMDNFITQKVDLILISPFEAAPLTPVVARAMKAGIPVIELDRKTVGEAGKEYTAFIGGDNFKIAEEAGKYVADKLLPQGGEVAVLQGLPSSTPAVERLNGFKSGVKGNAKVQLVA